MCPDNPVELRVGMSNNPCSVGATARSRSSGSPLKSSKADQESGRIKSRVESYAGTLRSNLDRLATGPCERMQYHRRGCEWTIVDERVQLPATVAPSWLRG